MPHPPQLLSSVLVLLQTPPPQRSVFARLHALWHDPQKLVVLISRQAPLQQRWPPVQGVEPPHLQAPPTQRSAIWLSQGLPHAPQ